MCTITSQQQTEVKAAISNCTQKWVASGHFTNKVCIYCICPFSYEFDLFFYCYQRFRFGWLRSKLITWLAMTCTEWWRCKFCSRCVLVMLRCFNPLSVSSVVSEVDSPQDAERVPQILQVLTAREASLWAKPLAGINQQQSLHTY